MIPLILGNYKLIGGLLIIGGLVIGYKVLTSQRDKARAEVVSLQVTIAGYQRETQVQKDRLAAALALSQQVKIQTVTKIKYITTTMPPPDAPDDAVRQWAIKSAQEIQ